MKTSKTEDVFNHELYTQEVKITDAMRKRRILFYGPTALMSPVSLINKVFSYFIENKTNVAWFLGE